MLALRESAIPRVASPPINAFSIARRDTPVISVATDDSLIPALSRNFLQPVDFPALCRGRWRTGPGQIPQFPDRRRGGTNEPATARARLAGPATPRREIGLASRQVPGPLALTSITGKESSSR